MWPPDIRPFDIDPFDICPLDICPFDICPFDICPPDICPLDICPLDICPFDICPLDLGPSDICPLDICPLDICPFDICPLDTAPEVLEPEFPDCAKLAPARAVLRSSVAPMIVTLRNISILLRSSAASARLTCLFADGMGEVTGRRTVRIHYVTPRRLRAHCKKQVVFSLTIPTA